MHLRAAAKLESLQHGMAAVGISSTDAKMLTYTLRRERRVEWRRREVGPTWGEMGWDGMSCAVLGDDGA